MADKTPWTGEPLIVDLEPASTGMVPRLIDSNGKTVAFVYTPYADLFAQAPALAEALHNLLSVCEKEFGTDDDWPDDDGVMAGTDGDSAITFGHLRRARAALRAAGHPDYQE